MFSDNSGESDLGKKMTAHARKYNYNDPCVQDISDRRGGGGGECRGGGRKIVRGEVSAGAKCPRGGSDRRGGEGEMSRGGSDRGGNVRGEVSRGEVTGHPDTHVLRTSQPHPHPAYTNFKLSKLNFP
jgi:hypothetical protein